MTETEKRLGVETKKSKVEFEQRIVGDMREIRMVIPTIPGLPLEDYVVSGEQAQFKIVKFVLAMSAGYCRAIGAPQLEEQLSSVNRKLVTGRNSG